MNIKSKLYTFAGLLSLFALTACNDYLDKLPDDRAEVNTAEKVEKPLRQCLSDTHAQLPFRDELGQCHR